MALYLELGHNELRCVRAQEKKKKVIILRAEALSFSEDIFKSKNIEETASLIKKFFKEKKIPRKRVYLSIYHRDIAFHNRTFPLMPEKEIRNAVINEIERNPHFSSRQYAFTFNFYLLKEEKKLQTLYFAFDRDILDFAVKTIKASGCAIEKVNVTPFNLIGMFCRYSVAKNASLILVKNKMTDLLFFKNNKFQTIYTLNYGLDDLWDKSLQPKNDEIKTWVKELRLLFKSYQVYEAKDQSDSTDCFLVWDNFRAPDLPEISSAELKKKISPFTSSHIIKKRKQKTLNYSYLPAIATVSSSKDSYNRQLRYLWSKDSTPEYRRNVIVKTIVWSLIIIVLGLAPSVYFGSHIIGARQEHQEVGRRAESLRKEIKKLIIKRDNFLDLRERVIGQAEYIARIRQTPWASVLAALEEIIPAKLRISSISFESPQMVIIAGECHQLKEVADFIRKMENSSLFYDVKLQFTRERRGLKEFSIEIRVNAEKEEN